MLSENLQEVQAKIDKALAARKEAKLTGETVTLVADEESSP